MLSAMCPMHRNLKHLINLLYGLAIATGLEYAVQRAFELRPLDLVDYLALSIMALLVGISDWVAYHLLAASINYGRFLRVILDISFPIIVYILFMSVEFGYFYWVLIAYSILSLCYLLLLKIENAPFSKILFGQYGVTIAISIALSIQSIYTKTICELRIGAIFAIILAIMWGTIAGILLNNQLKQEH